MERPKESGGLVSRREGAPLQLQTPRWISAFTFESHRDLLPYWSAASSQELRDKGPRRVQVNNCFWENSSPLVASLLDCAHKGRMRLYLCLRRQVEDGGGGWRVLGNKRACDCVEFLRHFCLSGSCLLFLLIVSHRLLFFPGSVTCAPGLFSCPGSYACVPKRWLCDGERDCPDGSDELSAAGCGETLHIEFSLIALQNQQIGAFLRHYLAHRF